MSKINSDFLKKTISELLSTRKQRKFVETVELQIGLRDYDPDKRFNGSVRLPHKAYNNVKVSHLTLRSACSPMPPTSSRPLPTESPTLMLTVSRPLTRIRPRSRNGPRSTMSSLPVTPLPSRPPSCSETFWSRWVFSLSLLLRERRLLPRLMSLSTLSSSSPRRLLALVLLSELWRLVRTISGKTWPCLSTFWFPLWRRDGRMWELFTSRPRWASPTESLDDC